jgi:hypothetical protein
MTATHKAFKWFLWPHHTNVHGVSDEFIAKGFRVHLTGSILEVSFEVSGTCSPDSAKSLAENYVNALAKHLAKPLSLTTEAEWLARTAPPFGNMTMIYDDREDRGRVVRAIREARNELLASEDETLRRCYNHLQDARERIYTANEDAAYDAYKAIEVLVERFGDEKKAIAALGKILKTAKTAANTKRHIPKKGRLQPKPSVESVELTRQVIRKFERYLLGHA